MTLSEEWGAEISTDKVYSDVSQLPVPPEQDISVTRWRPSKKRLKAREDLGYVKC
jgi:hypothetical protein